jgi:D-glycero-D-manno-heptose 1,7-bisphosphate phosphatase
MLESGGASLAAWHPQAIFLDRDGTINRERADYVKSWQEYEWLPGARAALAGLAQLGAPVIIVTNQSAVGRGILDLGDLDAIHERVRAEAAAAGGRIDHFLICPHDPAAQCECRKPKPGLLLQAAARYNLNLAHCLMIGDSITDLLASAAAGCPCILVRTGRQGVALDALVAELGGKPAGTLIADDLGAVVALLLAADPVTLDAVEASCE